MDDDEARIHVESGAAGGRDDWSGAGASSRRVVHAPSRRGRVAAVVVVGLLVGGSALSLGGGGADDRPDELPLPESPNDAYVAAVARLGRARTFAYRGEVQTTERSALRPGARLDGEVSVEGAVLLPHSITREVAFTPGGGPAVETVTSGSTAWSHTASSRSGLPDVTWERVAWHDEVGSPFTAEPNPESLGSGRLGIALLADVLRATRERRPAPDDAEGHRVLRATLPADRNNRERFGDLLAGAEVALALDEAGDITGVRLISGPADDPGLVLELAIEQLGDPGLIRPADVGHPARQAADTADLAAAGIRPLELSRLPAGWGLTNAARGSIRPGVPCATGPGGCSDPDQSCNVLFTLEYHDLAAVSDGELLLSARSDRCFAGPAAGAANATGGGGGEPFHAGRFTGWAIESPIGTNGAVSDGETTVNFQTDLPAADAAVLLATLVPLDPATEPAVLPGVPTT